MSAPRTVWVAYRDNGYEGKSEPLAVFASKDMADVYLAGSQAGYVTLEFIELPILGDFEDRE